jgi:putative transposase
MSNDLPGKHRRSTRLPGFDYSQPGAYFVTLITKDRVSWFGDIVNDVVSLTPVGKMVANEWQRLPNRFSGLDLDEWVVMPDHLHGILILRDSAKMEDLINQDRKIITDILAAEGFGIPVAGSIPTIIRSFKSSVTHRFKRMNGEIPLWHRNYYEHVIRNGQDLNRVREYIRDNPRRWVEKQGL